MGYENWDEIIVQWANSLNITKPIEDVDSCKEGDFFWKFLRVLCDKTTISDDMNALEVIYSLLESVYIDFAFNKNRTYLEELSRDETIELCLLLMHYACVIEQNDLLIHPLCQKLPHKTQMCIRKFLETMTIKVTTTTLQDIAKDCAKPSEGAPVSLNWPAVGDSPLRAESPLQDYLRTPIGQRRLLEKDKQMKKLVVELEFERFDKADLQEEVKEHKEKIRKLESKLKESCSTVSQLRSELYNKENGDTQGEVAVHEIKDTEKYLKSEMENLQQYSRQLEGEQTKLQEKNEQIIEKLRVSNEELKVWQERAFGLETEQKDILERYRSQEMELENLKVQCGELASFLDELRSSSSECETSLFYSPTKAKRSSLNYSAAGDLAESIIDVQLRDCRVENAELKELLHESTEKSKHLDDKLVSVKKSYEQASRDCSEMQNKNDQLMCKIDELTESHKTINELLENSRKEVIGLSNNLLDKDSMIVYLKQSLTQTNELNNQFQIANEELKHELCQMEANFKASQVVLLEKDNICESLRGEAKTLQQKYEQAASDFSTMSVEFNNLRKCYNSTMEKFGNSLEKLAKLTEEYKNEIFEDKFEMFEMLLKSIQKERSENKNVIKQLTISLNESEDIARNLNATNMILNDKITLSTDERNKFEKMLQASELHVSELEKSVELKTDEINNISLKISELHNTINELHSLKPREINRIQENIVSNNFGKVLDNIINDIKKTKEDYNENISMKNKEMEALNNELMQVKLVNEKLTRESIEKEKSYLEKMFVLESEIKDYSSTMQCLEATIDISEQNLKMKHVEMEELQKGRTTMQENFDKVKGDLEKKINLTKDTYKKLEIEMQIIGKEKSSLEHNLKNLKNDLNRLELEKGNLIEQNNLLKQQYSECFESLSKCDGEVEERDNVISSSNKQLLNLKLELEVYKQKHKELQAEMDNVRQEESKYRFCMGTLEAKNKEFVSKLQQLTYEKDVLKDVKDNLEKKCKDLEHNLESIIAQLGEKNDDLNDYCGQLATCKRDNEAQVQSIKVALEEAQAKLEEITVERNDALQRYDEDITALKSDLHEADNRIYQLNSKEILYIQEIEMIKSELNNSFQKYAESFNAYQDLKLEHEAQVKDLTETLHEVVTKCNDLEQNDKDHKEQVGNIIKEQEVLRSEKIVLEVKLVNQQKKYNQELENTREQFMLDINTLKHKEKKLEQSLTKALNDLENGRGIQYRLENEVKKLTLKLHDIQQEKDYLQERVQLLEDTKKEVDSEYSQLKLTHEKYISESEHNLKMREKKLEADINEVQTENQKLINEYFDLQKAMEALKKNNELSIQNHEQTTCNLNTEVKCMTEKITNLESLNATISKEQENLSRNTRKMKLEANERTAEAEKQSAVISKLQCAYDILQTGKDRVEVDLQSVTEAKQKLEEEKIRNDALLDGKLKIFEEQLKNLNEELDKKNKVIVEKDKVLSDKMRELSELHKVHETMTSENQNLQEQYQQSQQLHKQFLSQIDEENLKTIGDMTFDFMGLKMTYQNIYHTLKKLKKEKKRLEKSLEDDNCLKKELQAQYEEQQCILNEIRSKSLTYENTILEERTKMKDIICELHCAISDLEWAKNAKFEAEKQQKSMNIELDDLNKNRDELFRIKSEFYKNKEEEIANTHVIAESLKNELLKTIKNIRSDFISSKSLKNQVDEIIQKEKEAKSFLEIKLLNLMNEKMKCEQMCGILWKNINKISSSLLQKPFTDSMNFANISDIEMKVLTEEVEKNIAEVYGKICEINESILKLQKERSSIDSKLNFLENEKTYLVVEKSKLINDYEALNNEKTAINQNVQHEKQLLQEEIDRLKAKKENLKSENDILHQTVQSLKQNNVRAYNDYEKFMETSKTHKNQLDKLLKDRNSTETIINDLKQKLLCLQMKFIHLPQEFLYKQYFDQKEALQVIVDDIQRQFNRYSRIAFNITCNFSTLSEKIIHAIFSEKAVEIEAVFRDLEIEEAQVKIEELRDRASDGLEQIGALDKVLDNLEIKSTKVLKENVKINQGVQLKADEEYRKKYISIKQKLTLAENVKNNYEKKLKQLREENKKLSANNKGLDNDAHYKMLIQQHIETKDGYETQIKDLKSKQQELEKELIEVWNEKNKLEETCQTSIKENYEKQLENLQEKQNSLEREIVELRTQKTTVCETLKAESIREIECLRGAYGKLMGDKSKLDSDYNNLKKLYDDRTAQLQEYVLIKEAYEKLLEESNQMMTEIDTLKFKRHKDKEEFMRLLKKEREEYVVKEGVSITKIRTEYESKLEAMKKKMLNMYKEEVDKEMRKVLVEKADNAVLLHTLERYKTELEDAKKTIEQLKKLNFTAPKNDLMHSRESLGSRSVKSECDVRELRTREVIDCSRSGKRSSVHPVRTVVETRKCMTLPKNMDVIEEDTKGRTVNPGDIAGKIEMEDEGECFHNKYLADLKEGRCVVPPGRESTSSRMSELAWRNSMVPPHLKSSYPAELQMVTPSKFKEEDIKAGIVALDDSMSAKLLIPDKTSRKKEQGMTSYKKPGPPTPSKNGGRVSLQGSELKDGNDSRTVKRSTPNKIKAFFLGRASLGRASSSVNNAENQPPSPKNREVNKLFRKAR